MTTAVKYDVVVVGQGPVGAAAACLLADEGLRVLAIDSELVPFRLPRAIRFDGETMRTFQRIGIAGELEPLTYVGGGGQFVTADGQFLGGWQYRPPTNGWENSYYFFQPELEALLNHRVDEHRGIAVRRGATLRGYRQASDEIRLEIVEKTGEVVEVVAEYLLGCDGARSHVRRLMGSGVDDIGYEERWIVVDAELLAEADLPPIITQHCDPRRPTTYVPGRGNHRRWEFMLDDHEDAAAFESPEAIGELLRRYVDPSKLNIIRAALYTFHSLVAKNWRDGRVFLAGDAAHQTPPFLGQGMCGGIRDAQNLSWKLAAVARGTAAEEVLDSYQREREPHFRGILERAIECGRIVGVFDQEAAAVRDTEFLARVAAGDVPFSTYQVPHLAGGLMPLDPIAPAGTLARQGRVATAGNPPELLDEVVGGGAVLLAHSGHVAGSPDADRLREASRDTGVPVWVIRTDADQDQLAFEHIATSHDNGLTAWLAEHAFVLVRPDRYVYDTAQSSDAAVALLNRWSTEALGRVALTPGRA